MVGNTTLQEEIQLWVHANQKCEQEAQTSQTSCLRVRCCTRCNSHWSLCYLQIRHLLCCHWFHCPDCSQHAGVFVDPGSKTAGQTHPHLVFPLRHAAGNQLVWRHRDWGAQHATCKVGNCGNDHSQSSCHSYFKSNIRVSCSRGFARAVGICKHTSEP